MAAARLQFVMIIFIVIIYIVLNTKYKSKLGNFWPDHHRR